MDLVKAGIKFCPLQNMILRGDMIEALLDVETFLLQYCHVKVWGNLKDNKYSSE
jgi:hypothetical protein